MYSVYDQTQSHLSWDSKVSWLINLIMHTSHYINVSIVGWLRLSVLLELLKLKAT